MRFRENSLSLIYNFNMNPGNCIIFTVFPVIYAPFLSLLLEEEILGIRANGIAYLSEADAIFSKKKPFLLVSEPTDPQSPKSIQPRLGRVCLCNGLHILDKITKKQKGNYYENSRQEFH
jgi:hypothetical protein